MRCAVAAALLCASLLGAGARARAAPADTSLGVQHFEAGRRLYEQGRYPQALVEFKAGYELTHRPAFLINIAQCYRQMERIDEALEHYRRYLAYDASSSAAAGVKRVMADLEAQRPAPSVAPLVVVQAPAARPRPRRVLTWTGVGLTASMLVIGSALAIATRVRYDDDLSGCAATAIGCSQAEHDGFVAESRAATGLLVSGAILGAATVVAAIVEARRAR